MRKRTLSALESVFPQIVAQDDCLAALLSAFQNLGLLIKNEGRLVPDPGRWQAFARTEPFERIAWLAAAANGRFTRDAHRQRAQTFLDFFASLEDGARYRRDVVFRLAFLLSERIEQSSARRTQGRFSAMLRERESATATAAVLDPARFALTDIARTFGLLIDDGDFLVKNSGGLAVTLDSPPQPYLVVSPSLAVTLMPGFSLSELLPLAGCMEVRDIQIAGQFEITRKSCAAAFDQGKTAESVVSLFRDRSRRPLPQNVEFSIQDWFRSYSAVSLYHGFILRVDESRRVFFENNETLSSLIRKTLAPGIYLLNVDSSEELQDVFSRANVDFLPAFSAAIPFRESVDMPRLRVFGDQGGSSGQAGRDAGNPRSVLSFSAPDEAIRRHRESLHAALDSLSLPPELDEALRSRIERKIVLFPAQLDPESVRIEKIEARGMDFLGKVRIAEYAIVSGSLLEIVYDEKEGSRRLIGRPISTEKRSGDVLLKLISEPDQGLEQISLGKAILVRRIRGSIFTEPPLDRT